MTRKTEETLYRVDVVDRGTETVSGKTWRGLTLEAAEAIVSFAPALTDDSSGKSRPLTHEGQEIIIRKEN